MRDSGRAGLAAGLGAFVIWGVSPLFWRLLRDVSTDLQLAHRILWSFVLTLSVLAIVDPKAAQLRRLRDPRLFATMVLSTLLVGTNWFTYLWGVNHDRVREVSLGYYANPLLSVLLGRLVLKERLSRLQGVAVALAAAGVGYLTWSLGALPWISVVLATSFGFYGLVRKRAELSALPGLVVETGLLAPLCAAYLWQTEGPLFEGPADAGLLIFSGVVTATPLALFAAGARRLRLSTIGMLQYLAPTLQLGLAIFVFSEPFTSAHAVTFGLIWAAVGLYALDAVFARRREPKA